MSSQIRARNASGIRARVDVAAAASLALLIAASACGGASSDPRRDRLRLPDSAPSWVGRGCSGLSDDGGDEMICALGSASGTRNPALARTTAISRARTELARSVEVRVEAMLRDYGVRTDRDGRGDDAQHVVDVSRQITRVELAGSRVVSTWTSDEGEVFALVALEVEALRGAARRYALPSGAAAP